LELGVPPSPPSQFRDNGSNTPNKSVETGHQHRNNNQDNGLPFSNTNNNMRDQNGNIPAMQQQTQKTFYYSPEKLAEINSSGNIQPFELTNVVQQQQPNSLPGQWTVIHQPQQQLFAIDPHQQVQATPRPLYPVQQASNTPTFSPQYPYRPVQNLQVQQHPSPPPLQQMQMQSSQGIPMLLHSPHGGPPTQCVVIQNPNTPQGPVQQTHQLVTLQNPNNQQSHIQHVYRLGIVQQPNPQTCIQVDGKAMRQYVDNQKIIESRFGRGGQYSSMQQTEGQRHHQRGGKMETGSDQTESELDIPFTPLKTYRLHPHLVQSVSDGKLSRSSRRLERLPKVKSRNVAIQMGHPGGNSANSITGFANIHRGAGAMEINVLHERNKGQFRSSNGVGADSPRNGLDSYINNPRSSRRNIYETYSEQYINLNSGRGPFVQKTNVGRSARRKYSTDPVLEDLVTIPPPTEFQETVRFPERRHHNQQPSYSFIEDKSAPPNNNPYPYCKDSDRSTTQYSYNEYSH